MGQEINLTTFGDPTAGVDLSLQAVVAMRAIVVEERFDSTFFTQHLVRGDPDNVYKNVYLQALDDVISSLRKLEITIVSAKDDDQ